MGPLGAHSFMTLITRRNRMINVPAVVLAQNPLIKKEYSHWQFFDHQLYIVQDVLRDLGYKPYEELIAWLEDKNQLILGGNMVYLEKQDSGVDWGYIRVEPSEEDKTTLSYELTKEAFRLWHEIKNKDLQAIAITRENNTIRMIDFELFKKEQGLVPEVNPLDEIRKMIDEYNQDDDEPCDCGCEEEDENLD